VPGYRRRLAGCLPRRRAHPVHKEAQ
jgi:hypothetical protein